MSVIQAELARLQADGLLRNVVPGAEEEATLQRLQNLQICPLSPHSEVFRSLPYSDKVRESVHALLGEVFSLHLDQIFLKPARHGAGTSWHQDDSYFGTGEPTAGVGMWIAVHDASVANGTMHIVPGSHVKALEHGRDPGSDYHIRCQIDETTANIVPVEMKAGGALFFNFGVAHCTKANETDQQRAGLALHFLRASFTGVARAGRTDAFGPLWGPEYDAGQSAWGAPQDEAWAGYVSAAS